MNIYAYSEDKTLINQLSTNDKEMQEAVISLINEENGVSLREFISEELFNQGLRKESANISFVLTSVK